MASELVQAPERKRGKSRMVALFEPDRLCDELLADLPAALRGIADALESGQMRGKVEGCLAAAGRGDLVDLRVTLRLKASVLLTVPLDGGKEVA